MMLELPYPPTINHYWKRTKWGGMRIGEEGLAFRSAVALTVASMRKLGPFAPGDKIRADIDVHPPDRRRRDIDNVLKAILDGLGAAGVYADDSQIEFLTVRRRGTVEHGKVVVGLTLIEGGP